MLALVKERSGSGNVRLLDVSEPHAGSGQVRVAVRAAGICGTDVHIMHGDVQLKLSPPVVMGHEFSGVIDEIGPGVEGWQIGDRVTAETAVRTCGRCHACRTGYYNRCSEKELLGYVHNGAFAPYVVVRADRVHRLPETVDFQSAALTEPLACCVRALCELVCIQPADVVTIAGPGGIGLLSLQLAKNAGAKVLVVGTESDAERLAVAETLGADAVLVAGQDNVDEAVRESSDGEGCDMFVECSGSPAAARMGLELTRRGGQYVQIGLAGSAFELDLSLLAYKELRMVGSLGQRWTAWRRALALLGSGQVQTQPLITHVFSLERWEAAFETMSERRGIKVLLLPGDGVSATAT